MYAPLYSLRQRKILSSMLILAEKCWCPLKSALVTINAPCNYGYSYESVKSHKDDFRNEGVVAYQLNIIAILEHKRYHKHCIKN